MARFKTHRALVQHMVHTCDGYHGFRHYAKFITLTNQCVHCRSTFKTRETAQAHTANAERTGACRTSRSKYDLHVIPITMMTCVVCGQECKDHSDMQTHLAQHSLNPPRVFKVPRHRYENAEHAGKPKTQISRRQARKRRQNRSPVKRAHHVKRQIECSTHRSTESTALIEAPIYDVAKFIAEDRTRTTGGSGIHVDAIAFDLSTSRRFRELNLSHAFASRSAARSLPYVGPVYHNDVHSLGTAMSDTLPIGDRRLVDL